MKIERMTLSDFEGLEHFSIHEKWGAPYMMSKYLVFCLHAIRVHVGDEHPIVIHCGYELRQTAGYHPKGQAVDFHIVGLHWMEQYLLVERFDYFNGIGIYPFWNNPGLHVDDRPYAARIEKEARWMKISEVTGNTGYDELSWENIKAAEVRG